MLRRPSSLPPLVIGDNGLHPRHGTWYQNPVDLRVPVVLPDNNRRLIRHGTIELLVMECDSLLMQSRVRFIDPPQFRRRVIWELAVLRFPVHRIQLVFRGVVVAF